jgi:hypothetical protein
MDEVVWKSTLDGRYEIVVVRIAPYQGKLTISDAGHEIFSRQLGLMYDALLGPDISDVATWQEIAVDFIDNKKA